MDYYSLDELNARIAEDRKLLISQGFYNTHFETNGEAQLMEHLVGDMQVMIDVGCHRGAISKIAYGHNRDLRFLMFDVLPDDAVERFSAHQTYHRKIMTESAASPMDIYTYGAAQSWDPSEVSSVFARTDYNFKQGQAVRQSFETETLDGLLPQIGDADRVFLKIDTEGSEIPILKGGKTFFTERSVLGYLEYHPAAWKLGNHTYKDLYRFFLELDYQLYRLTPLGLKEISYYHAVNEDLFCYYAFCRNGALDPFGFIPKPIERRHGLRPSTLWTFPEIG